MIHSLEIHLEHDKMNYNKEKVYKSKYQKIIPKQKKFRLIKINKILILNNFIKPEKSLKV